MTRTRPDLVNPEHVSKTMSNQSPFFPSSGFPGRDQASSFFAGPIGLALALCAVSYGVPAIHALVSGPQPKTVFSCMFRDSEQTMILYYYPRTWILADVQLAD